MSIGTIDTWNVDGLTVSLHYDEDCDSPRTYDNLGTMVCWHRRYTLGDNHTFSDPDDFTEWFKQQPGWQRAVRLKVFMYEHGNVALSSGDFGDPWDSGQVGWIYCLPEAMRKEYSCKRITQKIREDVIRVLTGEVQEYGRYVNGECYSYVIEDANGEHLDSCCGFIGYEYAREAAEEAAQQCTIVEAP